MNLFMYEYMIKDLEVKLEDEFMIFVCQNLHQIRSNIAEKQVHII